MSSHDFEKASRPSKQPIRNLIERYAERLKLAQLALGARDVFGDRVAKAPMIPERDGGRWWHGVDRVRPDQLVDVHHVAVFRILCAGARPKEPLRPRAFCFQRLPSGA